MISFWRKRQQTESMFTLGSGIGGSSCIESRGPGRPGTGPRGRWSWLSFCIFASVLWTLGGSWTKSHCNLEVRKFGNEGFRNVSKQHCRICLGRFCVVTTILFMIGKTAVSWKRTPTTYSALLKCVLGVLFQLTADLPIINKIFVRFSLAYKTKLISTVSPNHTCPSTQITKSIYIKLSLLLLLCNAFNGTILPLSH